jgi:protein-disulfide isomerase
VDELDHALGPAEAAVTLVEYGDYECPFCGRAHVVMEEILRALGSRLLCVFRHFPLATAHPHAELAAEAAECAASQGKFWEMHATLFANQDALEVEDLVGYANGLALDTPRFARELAERRYAKRVREDFLGGVRSGVNGTPTFFIDGVRYDGSWELEPLERALGARIARRHEAA